MESSRLPKVLILVPSVYPGEGWYVMLRDMGVESEIVISFGAVWSKIRNGQNVGLVLIQWDMDKNGSSIEFCEQVRRIAPTVKTLIMIPSDDADALAKIKSKGLPVTKMPMGYKKLRATVSWCFRRQIREINGASVT